MLPEEWPKRLVDLNVDSLKDKDLSWADMAFIGGMAVQRKSVKDIIIRCKQIGLKIVAGGPLFTAEPEAFGEVDHLVLGQRVIKLLKELKAPGFCQPINVQRFLSIFRSAFRLGILGEERFHYWQLMLWTLIRKPK